MELTKPGGLANPSASWPNMFIFSKELRDAIPKYGGRALVFDAVSGAPASHSMTAPRLAGFAEPRAHVRFLVHETGKLDGKFPSCSTSTPKRCVRWVSSSSIWPTGPTGHRQAPALIH